MTSSNFNKLIFNIYIAFHSTTFQITSIFFIANRITFIVEILFQLFFIVQKIKGNAIWVQKHTFNFSLRRYYAKQNTHSRLEISNLRLYRKGRTKYVFVHIKKLVRWVMKKTRVVVIFGVSFFFLLHCCNIIYTLLHDDECVRK